MFCEGYFVLLSGSYVIQLCLSAPWQVKRSTGISDKMVFKQTHHFLHGECPTSEQYSDMA